MGVISSQWQAGIAHGFTAQEVGNLIAFRLGLPSNPRGWTLRELAGIAELTRRFDRDCEDGREGVADVPLTTFGHYRPPVITATSGACALPQHRGMPGHRADHR